MMPTAENRHDHGLATMRTGPSIDAALENLAVSSPDLARCLAEFPFADIYPRSGLFAFPPTTPNFLSESCAKTVFKCVMSTGE